MLVHGVAWDRPAAQDRPSAGMPDGGSPALLLRAPSGEPRDVPLAVGGRLGFRVLDGLWCLGHSKVHGPRERLHVPCPDAAPAERGRQCGPCFARDDFRLMHDFHRGGSVPAGLRSYLMQPHWLYLATFAGGATKVGTASSVRKWQRLAEQGAVRASYVAHAEDGRVVRILEDLVTQELGTVQLVRSAAKAASLLEPLADVELSAINKRAAARTRELLDELALGGFSTVEEDWQRPAVADEACGVFDSRRRHPYPQAFDGGDHGFTVRSLSGATALVSLPGEESGFIAGLGALKGRRIEFGHYCTEVPALQDSLF
ncbi:DUF2797 domain-containing protein [Arthrobacter cupressi]|uniref:DUF2797 domain-containing protein n=1 Tax=Arthrobacter cupressi TaxID=1045773 RepID=A0A1G8XRY0_9MICC|nr:DUF2797 domain-containing protein [Arthrobacter cupressi]NYD77034.1 hypothetical protein [Arthrobacter cupressi]SDJ93298.1 Protein of unknown function [Arthrobacter cupressi]